MIFLAVIYCFECALKVSTIVSKLFSLALQILCLYVKHCRKRSRHLAYVKYCQTQSVTDCRELYLICHIMNEISLNVNVNLNVNVKIYGIVVDGIVTRHCRGRN